MPPRSACRTGSARVRIDRDERLLSADERVDQKVRRGLMRKEVDVCNLVAFQIPAWSETPDATGRNERGRAAIDPPSAFRRHDEIVRGREELVDSHIHQTLQNRTRGLIVRDERRIRVGRRPGRLLKRGDRIARTIHRMQARQIARQAIGEPHQPVRDERGAGRERVARKELQDVGEPADGLVPALRRCERRSVVRRRDEHGAAQLEAACKRTELHRSVRRGSAEPVRRVNGRRRRRSSRGRAAPRAACARSRPAYG